MVALLSLLAITPVKAERVAGIELEYNTNRVGGDFKRVRTQSAGQCARECSDDRRCRAFAYDRGNGKCWLKESERQPRYQEGIVSGEKRRNTDDDWDDRRNVAGILLDYDTNREGWDYRKFRAVGVEQCAEGCALEERCRAFAYDLNNRRCWLKEQATAPSRQQGIVSGAKKRGRFSPEEPWRDNSRTVVPKEIAGIKLYDNQRRTGNDYRVFESGTLQRCAHRCADDGRCQVFTFDKEHGDCQMMDTEPGSQHDWRTVSGVKQKRGNYRWPRQIGNIDIYYDVNRPGNEFRQFDAGSLRGCAEACSDEQRCDAFNYQKNYGVCQLKNRVPKGKRDTAVISGVKQGR